MDRTSIANALRNIASPSTPDDILQVMGDSSTRTLHPIFHKDRWIGLSDEEYVRTAPALVLATHLLTCPQTTEFFAAFVHAPRTVTAIDNSDARFPLGVPLEHFARPRGAIFTDTVIPPTFHQIARVRRELMALSTFVKLKWSSSLLDSRANGCTQCTDVLIQPGRPGMQSNISMNPVLLVPMTPLPPIEYALAIWLQIATTLVHEVCHALRMSQRGGLTPENIFEDGGFNELGAAFERLVFQGKWQYFGLNPGQPVPPDTVVTIRGGFAISRPHRDEVPRSQNRKIYAVKREWLWSIFTDAFWDQNRQGEGRLVPSMSYYRDSIWNSVTKRFESRSGTA